MNSAAALSFDPATIAPLRALIEGAGLSVERMLAAAGLRTDFFDGAREAHLADYFRLIEQIALSMGDEAIHMSLRPLMLGTSGLIRDRLRGARTVGEMFAILAQSYNIIHGARYNSVRRARGELVFTIDDADFPYAMDKDDPFVLFSVEGLLVYVIVLLQSSADRPLPLRAIRTRRRAGSAPSCPLGFWRAPVIHSAQHFALHYDRAAADWTVAPQACAVLGARTIYGGIARSLDRLAAPDAPARDIVERVRDALRAEPAEQDDIARRLGLSPASLRRRLVERATSFRALRTEVLGETARARLRAGDSVADIAEALGFSDGRSFARAFRAWTGLAPAEYRDRHKRD